MSDDESETDFGMVMPFLPVKSKGGPHDDDAFVAGYEMGLLDAVLRHAENVVFGSRPEFRATVHAENQGQTDLLAMRYGYHAEFTDSNVGGWVDVLFTLREAS